MTIAVGSKCCYFSVQSFRLQRCRRCLDFTHDWRDRIDTITLTVTSSREHVSLFGYPKCVRIFRQQSESRIELTMINEFVWSEVLQYSGLWSTTDDKKVMDGNELAQHEMQDQLEFHGLARQDLARRTTMLTMCRYTMPPKVRIS